jgi:hypothetical protein
MIFSSIDEWALTFAWGEIDPIPPVGAVMTHTCGSWYLLGRGGRALERYFWLELELDTKLYPNGEPRNGQAGPSPAVNFCTQAVPILYSCDHESVCTVLSNVQLLKENCQPQI